MNLKKVDDQTLVSLCLSGDRFAREFLYSRFQSKMYNLCFRYCKNSDDASDILQESFVKVFLKLDEFLFRSSLETWITRITINTAIDYLKKQNRFIFIERHDFADDFIDAADESDLIPQVSLDPDLLINLIKSLPDGARVVFNLYVFERLSHKDIALRLGLSEGTTKSQLSRARMLLKNALIERRILVR